MQISVADKTLAQFGGQASRLDFACREAASRGLRLSLREADADVPPDADELELATARATRAAA